MKYKLFWWLSLLSLAVTGASGNQVVFNEIMYHPAPEMPEDLNREWLELHNRGTNTVDLNGWRISGGVNYTFANVLLPAGGYLVVAANRSAFTNQYPAVNNVVGNWTGKLANGGETVRLLDALGNEINEVAYASGGDWAARLRARGERQVTSLTRSGNTVTASVFGHDFGSGDTVRIYGADQPEYNGVFSITVASSSTFTYTIAGTPSSPATGVVVCRQLIDDGYTGWSWSSLADGLGRSLELRNSNLPNEHGQNWAASQVLHGTPGQENSAATNNIPPLILNSQHLPLVPRAVDQVTVTAQLLDEGTSGLSAMLHYRNASIASPAAFTTAVMFDDGAHGDVLAGDGVFGAFIPAQTNLTVVEFYIRATDLEGNQSTWPAPALDANDFPIQQANALYQVDNTAYAGNQPFYRIIMTEAERAELRAAHDSAPSSDVTMNATFISADGIETVCRYNSGIRNRGAGTRSAWPMNYRVGFPGDKPWKGVSNIHLNTQNTHSQLAGYALGIKSGVDVEAGRVVQVRVNGVNLAQLDRVQYGSYIELEGTDGDYSASHWPDDPNGNLYRGSKYPWDANLDYVGSNPSSYQGSRGRGYYKNSNGSENDWTDLIQLCNIMSNAQDSNYVQAVREVVNVEHWMRNIAFYQAVGSGETGIQAGAGDDYSMYRGIVDPRFRLLGHDLDSVLGQSGAAAYTVNIFRMCPAVNSSANVHAFDRFMRHPEFVPIYYWQLNDLLDTTFRPDQVSLTLDQFLGDWVPASVVTSMKTYATNRYNYIRSRIPLNLTITHNLSSSGGYPVTTASEVALSGQANVIETRSVKVNGSSAAWTAWQGVWSGGAPLNPGLNRVLVQAFDSNNVEIARSTIDIWRQGATATPLADVIFADLTLTAAGGPYLANSMVNIESGVTLTVQPGTSIYFASGAGFLVNGTLAARGTATQRIRFTRPPGTTGIWGGLQFINAATSNVLAHVDMEYAASRSEAITISGSQVLLDHVTLLRTSTKAMDIYQPQVTIRNSVFGDVGLHSLMTVEQMLPNGWFILEGNLLGTSSGSNDLVRLNRVSVKGGPKAQILDNVFLGSGNHIVAANETDAHLEGNLFMRANAGNPNLSVSAAVATGSAGSSGGETNLLTQRLTLVRNVFYANDYGLLCQTGAFGALYNNVFVGHRGAIIFDEPWRSGSGPGRAAYIESCIFWNNQAEGTNSGTLVYWNNDSPDGHSQVAVNHSILPSMYHGLGVGNLEAHPAFARPTTTSSLSPTNMVFAAGFEGFSQASAFVDSGALPDLRLKANSPAVGMGFNGVDMGAYVGTGASIAGEPLSPTPLTVATLTVAGTDVYGYRYRLIGDGFTNAWSPELQQVKPVASITRAGNIATATVAGHGYGNGELIEISGADREAYNGLFPIFGATADMFSYAITLPANPPADQLAPRDITCRKPEPVHLAGLSSGTYRLEAVRKNSLGIWQSTDSPTRSRAWTIQPGVPGVVINEILARNVKAVPLDGEYPDLIELFNASSNLVDLSGMGLSDDLASKYKFTFPAGTLLNPGQYLVVTADDNPTSTLNTGFGLNQNGDTLYLSDLIARGSAVLDSVSFGLQLQDLSIGRLSGGGWALANPTFGAANVAQAIGDPRTLRINEWLANSQGADDFIELFNSNSLPVSLGGLYLTDNHIGVPTQHLIAPLSYIAGGGFAVFLADGSPELGAEHLNFRLSGNRGVIALLDPSQYLIDLVLYGPQTAGVSQGRRPSGSDSLSFFDSPTPNAANPGLSGSCTVTYNSINLMALTNSWRFDQEHDLSTESWTSPTYNDALWLSGQGLLAFENNSTLTPLIRTSLTDPRTPAPGLTAPRTYYFRTRFVVNTNLAGFSLTASAYIDDGAVIYLNGSVAARVRMPGGTPGYHTYATGTPSGGDATTPDSIDLPIGLLVPGTNVLAVEVHQNSATSSDIVWGMRLDAVQAVTNCIQIPVVLNEIMANNQSVTNADGTLNDWVELYNPTSTTNDLSDMSLSDNTANPRRWVFPQGSFIPPGGYLVVYFSTNPPSTSFSAAMNTGFGLDSDGDAAYIFDAPARGSVNLDSIVFGPQAADFTIGRVADGTGLWKLTVPTQGRANVEGTLGDPLGLRVNEWMANPNGGDDWFEICNLNPQPVSLAGFYLSDSLANWQEYKVPPLSFIGVGLNGFVKFIADSAPNKGAIHTTFRLNNGGEAIGIFNNDGVRMDGITFGPQANGISEGRFPDGSSTIVRFPGLDTPGQSNLQPLNSVLINEVLAHASLPLEDAIELHNPTSEDVDISGWYLSNDKNDPKRFRIPDFTIIPAGGFVVFYEYQFFAYPFRPPSFNLSASQGDELYLYTADASGRLTGYRGGTQFGASKNGVSFGRFSTSAGVDFVALSQLTFGTDVTAASPTNQIDVFRTGGGASNAYPAVGPIVINEIMYHPPELGAEENAQYEYIELLNISGQPASLFDPAYPTNGWRLANAIEFTFGTDHVIPAGGYLLVVGFDPLTNATALAEFQGRYGLGPEVRIVGPYNGKLNNAGDSVQLFQPDTVVLPPAPEAGYVPQVLVERIKYSDESPWPSLADGNTNTATGYSLQRVVPAHYGNDPVNWVAALPTPGGANGAAIIAPPAITAHPQSQTVPAGSSVTFTVSATGDGPLRYQWWFNGSALAGATTASLTINSAQAAHEGEYTVLVSNPAGAANSAVARLIIQLPPAIIAQPQSQVALAGGTATFTVKARGTAPLSYQWRFNGTNLDGATGSTLVVSAVQFTDEGGYSVFITNAYGVALSTVATLSINQPPVILAQPQNTSAFVGSTVLFQVQAIGSAPLRYQWRFNGINIAGATNATLTLPNVQTQDAGAYSVVVVNYVGSLISDPASLTVTVPPIITVTAPDASASEPGADQGLFRLSRTGSTAQPLTVYFAVTGSAVPGVDYEPMASSVTFASGISFTNLTIKPLDDGVKEGDETVVLTLQSGGTYAVGTPSAATVVIRDDDNRPPSVTLTTPVDGTFYTAPAVVTIAAAVSDVDGTIAKVEFYQGTNKLGAATAAPYTVTWTNAPGGTYLLTAVATDELGATGVSQPVTILVNSPPTVGITSPANNAVFASNANVIVAALASDLDGSISLIEFFVGTNFIGADATSPYTVIWSNVPVGNFYLTARATDDRGASTLSAPVAVTVNAISGGFADAFANRGILAGYTNEVAGNSATYTREVGEPRHFGRNGQHSAWISWIAPASGPCTMDTIGSSFDTVMAVYINNPANIQTVTNLIEVAKDDDSGGYPWSKVSFHAEQGATYQIAVDGYGSADAGTISFHLNMPNPNPVITSHPQSQVANLGASASFNVNAVGPGVIGFRWLFNGAVLPGEVRSALTVTNAQMFSQGIYAAVVNNAAGSVTSAPALLTIRTTPSIVSHPQKQVASPGGTATFLVSVSGAGPLNYQWRFNGTNISGANSSYLTITEADYSDGGDYSVLVGNGAGSVTSQAAELIVRPTIVEAIGLEGGVLKLTITGTPGKRYVVEESTNFSTWSVLGTVTNTSIQSSFTNALTPGSTFRSQRLRVAP